MANNDRQLENAAYEIARVEEKAVARVQAMAARLLATKQMSKADLARAMGVTPSYVSQIFADEPQNLSIKNAARIFYYLDDTLEFTSKGVERLNREAEARNAHRAALCEDANAFAWLEDDQISNDTSSPCFEELRDLVAA